MYLLPNPTTLSIHVRPDPKVPGNLIFSDAELFVRCKPGRTSRFALSPEERKQSFLVPFKLLEVTRAPDCRPIERSVWEVEDRGPAGTGNARVVRVAFLGSKYTEALARARQDEKIDRDDPKLTLRETILHQGCVGIHIEIDDPNDKSRGDTLLVDLRYVLHGDK